MFAKNCFAFPKFYSTFSFLPVSTLPLNDTAPSIGIEECEDASSSNGKETAARNLSLTEDEADLSEDEFIIKGSRGNTEKEKANNTSQKYIVTTEKNARRKPAIRMKQEGVKESVTKAEEYSINNDAFTKVHVSSGCR